MKMCVCMVHLFSRLRKQFILEGSLGPYILGLPLGSEIFLCLEKQVKEEAAEKQ